MYVLDDDEKLGLIALETSLKGKVNTAVSLCEDGVHIAVQNPSDAQLVYDLDENGESYEFPYFVEVEGDSSYKKLELLFTTKLN